MTIQTTDAFEETQRFTQRWLMPLLMVILAVMVLLVINGIRTHDSDQVMG
jgi:cell division protein FtsX